MGWDDEPTGNTRPRRAPAARTPAVLVPADAPLLLLTGARSWWDYPLLAQVVCRAHRTDPRTVLIHGDCPASPDEAGSAIWRALGGRDIPVPAAWQAPCRLTCAPGHRRRSAAGSSCPAAGMYRNEAMVARLTAHAQTGAPVAAVAFLTPGSRGARHCAGIAEAAGITLERHHSGPRTAEIDPRRHTPTLPIFEKEARP